ncbi:MAG: DNA recombination protein RmuC [Chitinophagaceae bacterium]|nr:DNA recombination protein RmuC [Chitinophagaceae bacterium]
MDIFSILIGIASGAIVSFLFFRLKQRSEFVPLLQHNVTKQELDRLKIELANRMSREELAANYVSRDAFLVMNQSLLKKEEESTRSNDMVIHLTGKIKSLETTETELQKRLSSFREEVEQLHKLSREQFENLANRILDDKKAAMGKESKLELGSLLEPLKSDLKNFKDSIESTRKEDIRDVTSLKLELKSLQELNKQLSDDARNLTNALRSDTRVQGDWGEDRLKTILEAEGLQRYIDYTSQESYRDEEQKTRRPDFILKLPNDKHIIIDSKVSLTAYVNYFNASNPEERKKYLHLHVSSVIDHIDQLSDKNYCALPNLQSPDYVFMFMPIESAITLALAENPEIFNRALKKKIVLITPSTLVATLKIIRIIWQKENQVKNVEEIFKQCGLLYDKFVGFLEEMDKVGTSLTTASRVYKDAMDKLKDGARRGETIIGRFDTIRKLEARVSKQIPPKYIAEIDVLDNSEDPLIEEQAGLMDDNQSVHL